MANFNDTRVKFTSIDAVKPGLGLMPIRITHFRVTATDLTAATTTQTFLATARNWTNGVIPAGAVILGAAQYLRGVLAGGDIASAVIDIGTSGNPDAQVDNMSIFTGASTVYSIQAPSAPGDDSDVAYPVALDTARTLQAVITTGTGDVNEAAASGFHFEYFCWWFAPLNPYL